MRAWSDEASTIKTSPAGSLRAPAGRLIALGLAIALGWECAMHGDPRSSSPGQGEPPDGEEWRDRFVRVLDQVPAGPRLNSRIWAEAGWKSYGKAGMPPEEAARRYLDGAFSTHVLSSTTGRSQR